MEKLDIDNDTRSRTTLNVKDNTHYKIKLLALAKGKSMGAIVGELVEEYFNENRELLKSKMNDKLKIISLRKYFSKLLQKEPTIVYKLMRDLDIDPDELGPRDLRPPE